MCQLLLCLSNIYENKIIKYYTNELIITRWWPMIIKITATLKNNDNVFPKQHKNIKTCFWKQTLASENSFLVSKMPFQSKVSIILYKWLPSRCSHFENIYVPASWQGIKPSTLSLFSTTTTNLLTGHSRYLDFWFDLGSGV